MLSPGEALATILERVRPTRASETVPLGSAARRVLARAAVSDVDLPPFEKAMMDGFALRGSAWDDEGAAEGLRCVGESRAGAPFTGAVPRGACIEIYTGAELPPDCDAVEMIERTRREGERVFFEARVPRGRHVSHRGEILAEGRTVFEAGRRLSPVDLSVLASIGCDPVEVRPRPRVSVLTTGDELVPPSARPGAGQIREGNTRFLAAACVDAGAAVLRSEIVPDRAEALDEAFGRALDQGDALVTTGGVSVGKYDLVGAAFERLGVEPILHRVAIKPGKPIWFGMRGEQPVFGLPGNPVSSLLGFEAFVRPALAKLAGEAGVAGPRLGRGVWAGPPTRSSGRQHNLPARIVVGPDGVRRLEPLAFRGSADHVSVSEADALVIVPADSEVATGAPVEYRPLR